jgi:signal transduction histidine kinase
MQTHVHNAALQFREALDGEIARAIINLQVGATTARDGFSDRYSDRYDAWLMTAGHPRLVANVLLVDADGDQLQLRRWNQATHAFEPFDWPAVLAPWRPQFEEDLKAFRAGLPVERRAPPSSDDSLVMTPLRPAPSPPANTGGAAGQATAAPTPVFGATVVQLDLPYIRTQLLPELAERYFMLGDDGGYRVAVTGATEPAEVIYRSDPDTPLDPESADASEPLFGVRSDFFFGRIGNGRGDARRTIILNRFRELDTTDTRGAQGGRNGRAFDRGDFGRWVLIAQHKTGSLDAAVTLTRNRNLGISFGILLLLSLSVGMLALSSRRAQSLARQQIEFVAGVSHELRTPIAVIRSAAENLSEGVVGSPERVKRYGEAIGTEARRLGETVEHVIQYAGLESGRGLAAYTPIAPAVLVEETIAEALPVIRSAGVTVHQQLDGNLPPITGDPIALRSAVGNLIANAVKYGGDDRWLNVRAEAIGDGRHRQVRIVVEDHGAGIPADDLPHIFEPFYRGAEAIGKQIHGNGLGLSIVKRIVDAHRGQVTVATRPGKGSVFTIVLPAADPSATATLVRDSLATSDGVEAHSRT